MIFEDLSVEAGFRPLSVRRRTGASGRLSIRAFFASCVRAGCPRSQVGGELTRLVTLVPRKLAEARFYDRRRRNSSDDRRSGEFAVENERDDQPEQAAEENGEESPERGVPKVRAGWMPHDDDGGGHGGAAAGHGVPQVTKQG